MDTPLVPLVVLDTPYASNDTPLVVDILHTPPPSSTPPPSQSPSHLDHSQLYFLRLILLLWQTTMLLPNWWPISPSLSRPLLTGVLHIYYLYSGL